MRRRCPPQQKVVVGQWLVGTAIANHRIDGQIDVDFGHKFVVVFVVDWPTWRRRQIGRRQWRKDMKKEKRWRNVQGPKWEDVWEEDNNSRIETGKCWWRNWTKLKTVKNSTGQQGLNYWGNYWNLGHFKKFKNLINSVKLNKWKTDQFLVHRPAMEKSRMPLFCGMIPHENPWQMDWIQSEFGPFIPFFHSLFSPSNLWVLHFGRRSPQWICTLLVEICTQLNWTWTNWLDLESIGKVLLWADIFA